MYTVNPELIALAKARFEKQADGMSMDPAAMGAPPADPSAMGAAPPMDPSAMGAVAPAAPADPATAMAAMQPGGAPPAQAPMAPATPTGGAAGQQKLKPEQMMQMLDYRLYNMQQQLTAIMNAMGVQVAPESLVLPPGTTGAPPAETALPGGPMAPPPPAGGDPSAQGAAPPPDAMAAAGAPPADPTKAAWWQLKAAEQAPMHVRAAALKAVYRSLDGNAD